MKRIIVGSSLIVLASSVVLAQGSDTPLSFEAASLKPAEHPNSGNRIIRQMQGGPGTPDPGMYHYSNVTLKMLIIQAYNLKEFQVTGPDWIDSQEYDLNAKLPMGATQEQAARMMQTLLAERFHLVFHRETKPMQVYALAVGKGGSKMKEVEVPAPTPGAGPGGVGAGGGFGPGAPPPPGGGPGRGPGRPGGITMSITPDGVRVAGYMSMRQLTDLLTRRLEHPVLDETELKKTYDVDFSYMPDDFGGRGPAGGGGAEGAGGGRSGGDSARAASQPAMTLEQALQEKLGLKLETRKSPAEILTVDRADKVPVEN